MRVYELTKDMETLKKKVAELYMQKICVDDDAASFQGVMNAINMTLEENIHSKIIIAEEDGELCGIAFINFGVSLRIGGRYIWLDELYVRNQYRKKGIGKKLLLYIIHKAESEGMNMIELETGINNFVTQHIYHSLGFYEIVSKRYGFTF